MSEENSKTKKYKFNTFDFAVLIIFTLILSVVGLKIHSKFSKNYSDTQKFSFTIETKNLDIDFQNKISVGDGICDSVNGCFYGHVSDLKIKPAQKITEDNVNGIFIMPNIPEKIDIEITVDCNANISDDSITIENNPVRIGKLIPLKSKGYVVYGYIIDMETE